MDIHFMVNGFAESAQNIERGSREEVDVYLKSRDHRAVLEYERAMHRVALDVPVYGSRFIKPAADSLIMLPFDHERPAVVPKHLKDPADLLSDAYDLRNYYQSRVGVDVL